MTRLNLSSRLRLPRLHVRRSTALLVLAAAVAATAGAQTTNPTWSGKAQHMLGLDDIKPKHGGKLTIDGSGLRFESSQAQAVVAAPQLIAINEGGERMELWGTKGQILRMFIPNGGGIALAAVAHHRVGLLTVEYRQPDGARRAAVFALPESEVHRAVQTLRQLTVPMPEAVLPSCLDATWDRQAVRVVETDWTSSDVPEAYRALLNEALVNQLRKKDKKLEVYRYGQLAPDGVCARYTLQLTASRFAAGNQVQRSAMGPIGLVVGTTKISMNAVVRDEQTRAEQKESIATSVRDQSESYSVMAKEAKKIAGHFLKIKSGFEKRHAVASPNQVR